jgi:hypothetical protein
VVLEGFGLGMGGGGYEAVGIVVVDTPRCNF